MATVKRFEDLDCWKISLELCNKVGEIIDSGSFEKHFRLIGQIEGSSGSIMDNIAESFERGTRAEFMQFLGYAKGFLWRVQISTIPGTGKKTYY